MATSRPPSASRPAQTSPDEPAPSTTTSNSRSPTQCPRLPDTAGEERLGDADRQRRREAEVGDGDERAGARRDRVVGAALGRVARPPATPALESAEQEDQEDDRVREGDR